MLWAASIAALVPAGPPPRTCGLVVYIAFLL